MGDCFISFVDLPVNYQPVHFKEGSVLFLFGLLKYRILSFVNVFSFFGIVISNCGVGTL